MNIKIRSLLVGLMLTTAFAYAAPRPNIVYFFADDMGWGTIRANQKIAAAKGVDTTEIQKLIMPNIDSLSDRGLNFSHAYGNPVCSPSRACQQTGFHQGHTWADWNDKGPHKAMRTQDPTLGKLLAATGYRNGMYGKWGYGGSLDPLNPVIVNPQTLPIAHGYHDCVVELHHVRAHTFLQPSLWYSHVAPDGTVELDTTLRMNKEVYPEEDLYADNFYAAGAIDFIRAEANGPSPFFVQLSFQIPHAPFDEIETVPGWFDAYAETDTAAWSREVKQYAAMITLMDTRIGEVIATLRDPNGDGNESDSVLENTLLIFSSDNGGSGNESVRFFNGNGHLNGYKGAVTEGGIRDPLVFCWDGVIPPGTTTDHKTCITDILPTFCELAGVAAPVGVDGTSIAPLLTGKGEARKRPVFCYEGYGKNTWRWSLVRDDMKLGKEQKTGKLHLYNLSMDESEQNNLAENPEYEEIMKELLAIALDENLEADKLYANVFPTWIGGNGADVNAADSWKETGKWDFDIKWPQSKTPDESWNARVVNAKNKKQTAHLDTSIKTLGFEVAGNSSSKALMELTLKPGITLTGRNEIRLAPFSSLKLNGSTLSSVRWIDVFEQATLQGTGRINSSLYNAGLIQAKGMVVSGDYNQSAVGTLEVEVGNKAPLTVNGKAVLNGILKCTTPSGKGTPFKVLSAASINGSFTNPNGLLRSGGQTFRIQYKADKVILEKIEG
ncbi:sulfatase-like hydrolase/transferase [Pontiella sulfatireligans]|uniref:Arylsulfatase n=1 Tax=Pontiella sulfatireligans TaxID=2750658 RepID=A0A6C2UFR9_9BACT|nr:sulfatase-like hydrolase/transferase [Pontiella sulfatireligans]SPS74232.1 sulfatase S1_20 [Kiritimatiellales bacterium]VGO18723.1 Arylsulfatase [Pontiella sulfatireligans]